MVGVGRGRVDGLASPFGTRGMMSHTHARSSSCWANRRSVTQPPMSCPHQGVLQGECHDAPQGWRRGWNEHLKGCKAVGPLMVPSSTTSLAPSCTCHPPSLTRTQHPWSRPPSEHLRMGTWEWGRKESERRGPDGEREHRPQHWLHLSHSARCNQIGPSTHSTSLVLD